MTCRPECKNKYTHLQYWSSLDLYKRPHPVSLTGIIVSLGPGNANPDLIKKMIQAGATIFRLSIGQTSLQFIETLRTVNDVCEEIEADTGIIPTIGYAIDSIGREPTIAEIDTKDKVMYIEKGALVNLNCDPGEKKSGFQTLCINFPNFVKYVDQDSRISINHGDIMLKVRSCSEKLVKTIAENAGVVRSFTSVQVPGVEIDDVPILSDIDIVNIKRAIQSNITMLFLNQMCDSTDISKLKEQLGVDATRIMVVPKIATRASLKDLDDIIAEADAVCIGRGDLSVQAPPQKLFLLQKIIAAKCMQAGKPFIVSTGFLKSMIDKPRPTRAEMADLSNAILDGAGAIMLHDPVAWGKFPVQTVAVASNICREAESALPMHNLMKDLVKYASIPSDSNLALGATIAVTSYYICAKAIVVFTTTGRSAFSISRFFPCCPILAVTRNAFLAHRMSVARGIIPILYPEELLPDWKDDILERLEYAITYATCEKILKKREHIIIVHGWRPGPGHTNSMRIHLVGDTVKRHTI